MLYQLSHTPTLNWDIISWVVPFYRNNFQYTVNAVLKSQKCFLYTKAHMHGIQKKHKNIISKKCNYTRNNPN